ncbi:MAG: DNA internalization-related competence protein ComEC/Rec2 [Azoarcus sp.]|nr:DNA internalization-related competence protein ComEC/Rec2 [Azoarcus sp.]
MCGIVFGILLGVCCLQRAADLPFWSAYGGLVAVIALAVIIFRNPGSVSRRRGVSRLVCWAAAFVLGYAWAAWRADIRIADALDARFEGHDLILVGTVSSLPDVRGEGVRFVFEIEQAHALGAEGEAIQSGIPHRVQLSWFQKRGAESSEPLPNLQPGERWRLPVRLKKPHGAAVPGVFDFEAWLLERGVRATGTVRGGGRRLHVESIGWMSRVHRLRARIRRQFEAALPDAPYRGILVALAVGEQNAIEKEQWETLRRTGVSHLVAISGLHVSLVALAAGGLCMLVWRRLPRLALRCPARMVGAVTGLAAASAYAVLSGLGIPAQRALVMLAVMALCLVSRRETAMRNVLALALFAVLAVDPWAVLTAGFWLSFGAVAVIALALGGRVLPLRGWRAAARLQLAITLVTIPVLAALFQGFSLASPFANAFAIPMVSFAIAPMALVAAIFPAVWLLELAHTLISGMMTALQWLAAFPVALHDIPLPPTWLLLCATAATVQLILPRGTPGRLMALAVLGGFFLWQPPRPAPGEFRAAVLDVGQGLAVHLQTAHHDMLYDTGPLYGEESDAGGRIVLPYLRAIGVKRLDAALISHDDSDHAGGLESVRLGIEIKEIMAGIGTDDTPEPPTPNQWNPHMQLTPIRGTPCAAGLHWQWDAVDFTLLAPPNLAEGRRDNDASCVLRVSTAGGKSLLLTGDIARRGEEELVRQYGSALQSTAVIAAHHGSRSSSTPAFVDATNPGTVIFSAGYRNRYNHPHPQVQERWQSAGAKPLRTDLGGTVFFETDGEQEETPVWREKEARYWHGR